MRQEIADGICELLRLHQGIDSTNIQFEIHEEQVILIGSVPEEEMKKLAELAVAEFPGVQEVWNLLKIKNEETISP